VQAPLPSRAGLDLATTLERIQQSFVVSDPNLPDCPIVFASDGFIEYTGCARQGCRFAHREHTEPCRRYTREEVLGRNCRFLQGPGTDKRAVREIRKAIESRIECTVRLLNYTKSGQAFWNLFSLAPVLDADGSVRFFIGVQVDVTSRYAGELRITAASTDAREWRRREDETEEELQASSKQAAVTVVGGITGLQVSRRLKRLVTDVRPSLTRALRRRLPTRGACGRTPASQSRTAARTSDGRPSTLSASALRSAWRTSRSSAASGGAMWAACTWFG